MCDMSVCPTELENGVSKLLLIHTKLLETSSRSGYPVDLKGSALQTSKILILISQGLVIWKSNITNNK